ncbi:MAG: hypothetical protein J6Y28_06240 [Acholeplasmatales bacterium]|nr:hypothetical protein [Acholeplasmatales bacterium]
MKLGKALCGIACLSAVFMLAACKNKKTEKKETTKVVTTTKAGTTTKAQTTTKKATTTKAQTTTQGGAVVIPTKYRANKEAFDMFFAVDDLDKFYAINMTLTCSQKMNGVEMQMVRKYDEGWFDQVYGPEIYKGTLYKDGDKYCEDAFEFDGTYFEYERTREYEELSTMLNMNFCPVLDFTKFEFDFETNTYKSDEVVTFSQKNGTETYNYRMYDFEVKYEDGEIAYIMVSTLQTKEGSEEAYNQVVKMVPSEIGTTEVEKIAKLSSLA